MYTLSKQGRQMICNRVGITDNKSIFINNEDAFNDRMDILDIMYNTGAIIKTYCKELASFESEKQYIKFLNECKSIISEDIKNKVTKCMLLIEALESKNLFNACKSKINFNKENNERAFLRIGFQSPLYEGLKYVCTGLYEIEENVHDYIYNLTQSEFLASVTDLDKSWIDKSTLQTLIQSSINLSLSMFDVLSPSIINKNELSRIGEAELIYTTSSHRSIQSLDKIYDALLSVNVLKTKNAEVELYKEVSLAKNASIQRKQLIYNTDKIDYYNVFNYDTPTLIAYLRNLYNQPMSKYDRYFEYKGNEAKLSRDIKIDWI